LQLSYYDGISFTSDFPLTITGIELNIKKAPGLTISGDSEVYGFGKSLASSEPVGTVLTPDNQNENKFTIKLPDGSALQHPINPKVSLE
jgi:hypothetical protein